MLRFGMILASKRQDDGTSAAALTEAADVVLSFGAAMVRAGNTASRTRDWVEVVARKLSFDAVSVSLSLDSITASLSRSGISTTAMREIGPPGINAIRIIALEQFARTAEFGITPPIVAAKLAEIESTKPPYSGLQIAAAVGAASGAFAFSTVLPLQSWLQLQSAALPASDCVLGYRTVTSITMVLPHRPPFGVRNVRPDRHTNASPGFRQRVLFGRLHRLGAFSCSRLSVDWRPVRSVAARDPGRREPPGIRNHAVVSCRLRPRHCHQDRRNRRVASAAV